jgi:murein DD-endopeptidase MepM/ murein hydrolase activator NlpD
MRLTTRLLQLLALFLLLAAAVSTWLDVREASSPRPFDAAFVRLSPREIAALPEAVRWDAPLGSEHGALTYNAQPFRTTRHLGDDLNGIGGYNSDLGDPVFAAATGKVVYRGIPGPGWGHMIILAHRVHSAQTGQLEVVQSVYAHLDTMLVAPDQVIARGQQLGTVGTAFGKYLAHLHFEIRMGPYIFPGVGYADSPLNCVSPEQFIAEHRGAVPELLTPAVELLK